MPTGAFNICCPRDAVSRTANVERTGRHKWVNSFGDSLSFLTRIYNFCCIEHNTIDLFSNHSIRVNGYKFWYYLFQVHHDQVYTITHEFLIEVFNDFFLVNIFFINIVQKKINMIFDLKSTQNLHLHICKNLFHE